MVENVPSAGETTTPKEIQVEAQASEPYVIHLPVFEGPIDLLWHLIEKRQMEITTISLVAVTDQYLAYLRHYEAQELLPLASMSEFVSIAARLLYIKSQSLLPQTQREQNETGVTSAAAMAEELQRHLLEYKIAKDISRILREREAAGLQTYGRSSLLSGIEAHLAWTPPTLSGMDGQLLAQAYRRLLELQARDEANGSDLMPIARVRVSERIAEIRSRLEESSSVTLADILGNETSRFVIIVTFIAVLELWKWQRIEVTQEALMGPILLERGPLWNETWQIT
jgi:segregation and condensation protein A